MVDMVNGPANLHRYLDQLVTHLGELLPEALSGAQTDAIHDARVATRRLSAALDLLTPVMPTSQHKRLGKALKRIRRRLGPLRDLDVMLGHLREMARRGRLAQAASWVRGHLERERDDRAQAVARKSPTERMIQGLEPWWALRHGASEIDAQSAALLAECLPTHWAAFADRATVVATAPDQEGTDLHALRIAGKHLRYTLEMCDAAGYRIPRSVTKIFKRLQDALGLWHDHVVLCQRILELALEKNVAYRQPSLYVGPGRPERRGLAGGPAMRWALHCSVACRQRADASRPRCALSLARRRSRSA